MGSLATCIILSSVGSFLQIKIEPIDWLLFGVFLLFELLFFIALEKAVKCFVLKNAQIKKIRLLMYETIQGLINQVYHEKTDSFCGKRLIFAQKTLK